MIQSNGTLLKNQQYDPHPVVFFKKLAGSPLGPEEQSP
jgi:hypothetical protein